MTTLTRRFKLAREVPPRSGDFKWVYLWGAPLRAMHWLAAFAIVILAATGFYIGRPYFMTPPEAAVTNVMSLMRRLHFWAAGVLVATGIIRCYWLLVGNRYERLRALMPGLRDLARIPKIVANYLMTLPDEKTPHYLGHNPLQQLSYTAVYGVTILMVVTGFAMYGQYDPGGFWFRTFAWVGELFGGMPVVRFIHHVTTWVFIIFVPMHIYLSLRADGMDRTGTISSIVSGGQWVPTAKKYVDED